MTFIVMDPEDEITCQLSVHVDQGALGAGVDVPTRLGQRAGAGEGIPLWEDGPVVLQPCDDQQSASKAHRLLPLPVPTPNPKADVCLCLCHR